MVYAGMNRRQALCRARQKTLVYVNLRGNTPRIYDRRMGGSHHLVRITSTATLKWPVELARSQPIAADMNIRQLARGDLQVPILHAPVHLTSGAEGLVDSSSSTRGRCRSL